MLLATEPVKAKSNRESHFEETNHPLPCVHSALHFQGIATPPTEEWQKHFSALFLCSVSPTRRQHRLTKPPPQRRAPPPAAVSAAPRHVLAPQGEQGWRGRLLCPVSAPRACACGARRDGRRGDGWGHVRHCRSSSTPSSSSWGRKRKGLGEEWGWGQPGGASLGLGATTMPKPTMPNRRHIRRGRADTDFFATQGRRWTSTDCQHRRLAPPATPAVLLACSRSRSREAAVSSSFSRARRRLLFLLPRAPLPPSPRAGNPLPPLR
jgi:hypothetical protein